MDLDPEVPTEELSDMKTDLLTTLETELERSLKFPYNNMTRVYRLGERRGPRVAKLPESYGGDCLEQVARLQARLREQGIPTKTILNPDVMHFALIGETPDGIFYLDPSLRALKPVIFDNGVEENTVNAYPRVDDQWSRLNARKNGDQLEVTWAVPNGDRVRSMATHRFALAEPDATPRTTLEIQRAWFAGQKSLYWQIPDPTTGDLLNIRMMKGKEAPLEISLTGKRGGYKPEESPEFQERFERVIALTQVSERDIREFITETRRRWLGFSSQL